MLTYKQHVYSTGQDQPNIKIMQFERGFLSKYMFRDRFIRDLTISPGTPASTTTKTGRHDIAEIFLKVALNTNNQIKSIINPEVLIKYFLHVLSDKNHN